MTEAQHLSIERVKQHVSNKVKVAVSDIDGVLRGKYLHKDKFLSAAKSGFGFCSVVFGWDCNDKCYDNTHVSGWHNGYPDNEAHIDLNTYREIPWDNNTPFFLAEVTNGVCPRLLLKRVIKHAESLGFKAKFGLEFEWFNFAETSHSITNKAFVNPTPITPGMFGYSITRQSNFQQYFHALMDELAAFDIPLEGLHTETGPGVYEAAILYSDALTAADRGVLFKTAVKEIAQRFEIMPSFMARWCSSLPGSGGHLHQSIWDEFGERNLFYNEHAENNLSETFKHYLAGQILLLPEVLPFYAPNINSYKRLVEGYWAPTTATWGVDNRTTAFRVVPGSAKSLRVETRVPGADINPYIAVAASLACGIYGIENKLTLPDPPIKSNAYAEKIGKRLARNLEEASLLLAKSNLAKELFGAQFVDHFVNTRLWEWREFQKQVTTYERERYFEII